MKKLFTLLCSIALFTACQSSMKVVSDYDKSVNFQEYKTFQLLPWSEDVQDLVSKSSQQLIDNNIKIVMEGKGYTYQASGADLVISTFVHLDEKQGVTAYNNYYGPSGYGYYGGWGYGYGYGYGVGVGVSSTTYQEYSYMVGSLIMDFYDQEEKKLVWQGIGTDELSDNRAKNQKKVPSYVRQVLYDFPVLKTK